MLMIVQEWVCGLVSYVCVFIEKDSLPGILGSSHTAWRFYRGFGMHLLFFRSNDDLGKGILICPPSCFGLRGLPHGDRQTWKKKKAFTF